MGNLERLFGIIGLMEGKPVSIRVNGSWHRIRPVERMLCLGGRAFSLKQVVHRKGGLIIGEGDTGKSTYAGLLAQALEQGVAIRWQSMSSPTLWLVAMTLTGKHSTPAQAKASPKICAASMPETMLRRP